MVTALFVLNLLELSEQQQKLPCSQTQLQEPEQTLLEVLVSSLPLQGASCHRYLFSLGHGAGVGLAAQPPGRIRL